MREVEPNGKLRGTSMNYVGPKLQARQTQIVEVLEMVCESLELSPSQFASAKQRYEGVGACLAGSDDPVLQTIAIYLQGSTALRTTVKPIGVNEHDVDLVGHVPDLDVQISPAALKKAIGDCLRGNGNYAPLLEEMPRCWRLNYANEFHMDITPSIPNPACRFGGELVPDKTVKVWKASNPKGYKHLFEQRAKLVPVIRLRKNIAADSARANVESYPEASSFKGILRRTVQIAKRHRDIMFVDDRDVAPLSVIITTLASRSYEWCVTNRDYDNELDLLFDVIRHVPDTIEMRRLDGRPVHVALLGHAFAPQQGLRHPYRVQTGWQAPDLRRRSRPAPAGGRAAYPAPLSAEASEALPVSAQDVRVAVVDEARPDRRAVGDPLALLFRGVAGVGRVEGRRHAPRRGR
jgi:hypothetical protein